ncbi:DnaJ domain-containing protein [Natronorubrum thiooxidans]|uniref:DnaJ domain-containing protein n=2 Tax=Natronorubrum thiooxidans TaxID=308853 RepID=A0A1N7E6E4_9EURY|nr:DnaJ domain-containing protein [Natronorubrum thiooxidans]
MGETYYDVLEVGSDATRDEIQAAYRERVLETHPDHNDAPDAAAQFKRVARAKSVLTDGDERARYDRLDHDAYVRLAQQSTASSEAKTTDEANESHRDDGRTRTETDRTRSRTASDRTDRAASHHARHRRQRQRRQARTQATDEWPFDRDEAATATGHTHATANDTEPSRASESPADSTADFRYAVHDWDGNIDLEWDGRLIDHTTAVTLGCLWLLYPILVAATLTPLFPTVVNGIVAACTLVLVGAVLTKPWIATALFGFWSLVFPLVMLRSTVVESVSVTGLLALGFVWVPFGYALGLWWALRP